jgi:hypothetical protein
MLPKAIGVKIGLCGDVRGMTAFHQEQTFVGTHRTSVSCQEPTYAVQQQATGAGRGWAALSTGWIAPACGWRTYSMTSFASASSLSGIVKPSALAVLRLMANSNFVGCSTGMSAGFAPRKILLTTSAARRNKSVKSAP